MTDRPVVRPAATLVLLDERNDALRLYLMRRSQRTSFMANVCVYPGGAVDSVDADVAAADCCVWTRDEWRDAELRTHAIASIRESFEEVGVLLASRDGLPWSPDERERDTFLKLRRAVHDQQKTMLDVARELDLRFELDDLVYFDRWVTPAFESKRFDARFFLARAPERQRATVDAVEATDGQWMTCSEALQRYRAGQIILAPPTWATLVDLERFTTMDALVAWARARQPIPVLPHFTKVDGEMTILLPGHPAYPQGELFAGLPLQFEVPTAPERTEIVLRDGLWCDRSRVAAPA